MLVASYELLMLGPPLLSGPNGPIRLPATKPTALLWYLAAHPNQSFPRAHLADLLWGKRPGADSRNSLRTALVRLRQTLPIWPLVTKGDSIALEGSAELWVDATDFLARLQQGTTSEWASPVHLWRGPFLEGVDLPGCDAYDEWLNRERQTWELRLLTAIGTLIEQHEVNANWGRVAELARQALAIDPLQERFHRWVMLALYQMGDRAAALNHFMVCRVRLRSELGIEPGAETTALGEAIEAQSTPLVRTGETGDELAAGALSLFEPPLVGRQREMAFLGKAVERALAGGPRVVMIGGEAGVGKSRLVDAVIGGSPGAHPSHRDCLVLRGNCYEEYRGLPYGPIHEILERAVTQVDLPRLPLPAAHAEALMMLLPGRFQVRGTPPEVATGDSGERQRCLMAAVAHLLSALPKPLVLVVEDLHWADEAAVLLLAFLARHPSLSKTAIIVTARTESMPGDTAQMLRQLQREGRLALLDLPRLDRADVDALVRAGVRQPAPELGAWLYSASKGNPLFAIEILRSPLPARVNGHVPDLSAVAAAIPRTVQDVIRSRCRSLPAAALHLLRSAAVFPQGVSFEVLREVSELTSDVALTALETLIHALFLEEPPTPGPIVFQHDLVRQVILADLSQARLRQLNARAFAAVAAAAGDVPADAEIQQLAHHSVLGERWESGVNWNRAAAAVAERGCTFTAAVWHLEQALRCLKHLPATPDWRRVTIDLRLQLAQIGHFFQPARQHLWLHPAEQEAGTLGDQGRLTQVWLAQASAYTVQGRMSLALRAFSRLLPLARMAGPRLLGPARTFAGLKYAILGQYDQAIQLLQEALPAVDDLGIQLYYTSARTFLICIYGASGEFDQAAAQIEPLIELHRSLDDSALLGHVLTVAAVTAHYQGRWDEAVDLGLQAIQHAQAGGHLLHEYVACVVPGLPLCRSGRCDEGIAVHLRAAELARRARTSIFLDMSYAWLAECYLEVGDVIRAETAARMAQQVARSHGYRLGAGLAQRALGRVLVQQGRVAEGREALLKSLRMLDAVGARPDAARCRALLSEVAPETAEREWHWRAAAEAFRQMGMAWDLHRLPLVR